MITKYSKKTKTTIVYNISNSPKLTDKFAEKFLWPKEISSLTFISKRTFFNKTKYIQTIPSLNKHIVRFAYFIEKRNLIQPPKPKKILQFTLRAPKNFKELKKIYIYTQTKYFRKKFKKHINTPLRKKK